MSINKIQFSICKFYILLFSLFLHVLSSISIVQEIVSQYIFTVDVNNQYFCSFRKDDIGPIFKVFFSFSLQYKGIETRVSYILGKYSTTPRPIFNFFAIKNIQHMEKQNDLQNELPYSCCLHPPIVVIFHICFICFLVLFSINYRYLILNVFF